MWNEFEFFIADKKMILRQKKSWNFSFLLLFLALGRMFVNAPLFVFFISTSIVLCVKVFKTSYFVVITFVDGSNNNCFAVTKNCATISQSISNTIEFFAIQMYTVIVAQSPQGKNVLENYYYWWASGAIKFITFPFWCILGGLANFFFFLTKTDFNQWHRIIFCMTHWGQKNLQNYFYLNWIKSNKIIVISK